MGKNYYTYIHELVGFRSGAAASVLGHGVVSLGDWCRVSEERTACYV